MFVWAICPECSHPNKMLLESLVVLGCSKVVCTGCAYVFKYVYATIRCLGCSAKCDFRKIAMEE